MQRDKFAHEVNLRKADAEIMAQEWAARTRIAATEAEWRESVADAEAFAASLTSEPKRYTDPENLTPVQNWGMVLLDLFRGLVRPMLTVYLCVLTTLIYMHARELIGPRGAPIGTADAIDLVRVIINTVLYLTTTCVLWWFGTRQKQKGPKLG